MLIDPLQPYLETTLNQVIRDSGALPELRALDGCVIAVSVKGLGYTHTVSVCQGQVLIVAAPQEPADVSVSGTPGAFLRMLRFGPDPALFRDGAVTIEGDAEAISNLKSLLGVLDFDGEEALAQVLGDTLARKAANGARLLGDWTAEITDSGVAGIAETLVEETRLLASRLRTDRFISDLDRLRDDAARLHQRINRLSSLGKPSSV